MVARVVKAVSVRNRRPHTKDFHVSGDALAAAQAKLLQMRQMPHLKGVTGKKWYREKAECRDKKRRDAGI